MPVARHGTLVANTVASVTFTPGYSYEHIEVLNRSGTAEIFFTVDGSTPVVNADDTYVLPAAIGALSVRVTGGAAAATVKLKSAGTPTYSVSVA